MDNLFKKIYLFIKNKITVTQKPVLKIRNQKLEGVDFAKYHSEDLPFIDIIIVTYNSQDYISRCIKSIENSQYPTDKISVVIVDNNSSDDTKRTIKKFKPKVHSFRLIETVKNAGFGAANNIGFKNTAEEYLLFLNPDTELKGNAILYLVWNALTSEKDGFCAWEARQQPYEHPKIYDPVTLETEWVSGACFLASRIAFERVAGFDENIFLYGEDVDISWRLRAEGYKLQYVPHAIVEHFTYSNGDVIKPNQYINSVISNGILRFKFGKFRDIIAYGFRIIIALIKSLIIKDMRFKLIKSLFAMIPNIKKSIMWRVKHKRQLLKSIPRFNGWDYEIRREGAFYIKKLIKKRPMVTVIIRTMQRPYFLREAIQSVRNQTYRPIEIIVVEDGAKSSEMIIKEFADMSIQYFSTNTHVGRCHTGNMGLNNASGKYINFLDDDDLFFADHIEVMVGELENDVHKRKAAYSTAFEVPTKIISTEPLKYEEYGCYVRYNNIFSPISLRKSNYIPINSMMFNRELFVKESGFDESLDILEDWDLWLRYMQYTDFIYVEKTTCLYRVLTSKDILKFKKRQFLNAKRAITLKYIKKGVLLG